MWKILKATSRTVHIGSDGIPLSQKLPVYYFQWLFLSCLLTAILSARAYLTCFSVKGSKCVHPLCLKIAFFTCSVKLEHSAGFKHTSRLASRCDHLFEIRNTGYDIKPFKAAEPKSWRILEYSYEIRMLKCFDAHQYGKKTNIFFQTHSTQIYISIKIDQM